MMSLDDQLEAYIWNQLDWMDYARRLVTMDIVSEELLLEKLSIVKDSIRRQIRQAVEQHYPHLVEQTSALQGLDNLQKLINHHMQNLFGVSEDLSRNFVLCSSKLCAETNQIERAYSLKQMLLAMNRCELLVNRLKSVSEVVKSSEIMYEMNEIAKENSSFKSVNRMKAIIKEIPDYMKEVRNNTVLQLKSSLETVNAPLISSCQRALKTLSCYDVEVKNIIGEKIQALDAECLKVGLMSTSDVKIIIQLSNKCQAYLEQFILLGDDITSIFCQDLAKIMSSRLPENSCYASQIVQYFSKICSSYCTSAIGPLSEALLPYKRAVLSQALSRIFSVVNNVLGDFILKDAAIEKINNVLHQELNSISWSSELKEEMELNVITSMNLISQRIENRLSINDSVLNMCERISSLQAMNYDLINIGISISVSWPKYCETISKVVLHAILCIFNVAKASIMTILLSMHKEELAYPSPYVKELCKYLTTFRYHLSLFYRVGGDQNELTDLVNYVIELFLLNSSLRRPLTENDLQFLSSDLQYVVDNIVNLFNVKADLLSNVNVVIESYTYKAEKLANCECLPFWFPVQLLISQSDPALLSPHCSANWSLSYYISWFMKQTSSSRLNLLLSLMHSYNSSVVSSNSVLYVSNYPYIMQILQRQISGPNQL